MHKSKANNYDDVAILRAKQFAQGQNIPHAYIEKPAMMGLLPHLRGKKVLCLGCGTGEECRELLKRGARVYGIDISEVSIEYAREHIPEAQFEAMDMDRDLGLLQAEAPFDVIYSSLAVHYSNDIKALLARLYQLLAPGGQLLFSTVHPLKWAAESYRHPVDDTQKSFLMGFERNGESVTVHGDYLTERCLVQQYPNGLKAKYWTRTPAAYFKLLTAAGYEVQEFLEPAAVPELREVNSVDWEINHKLPQWIVFLARKR